MSVLGDFHNATNTSTGGWAVTDKIFGYINNLSTDYYKVRTATLLPTDPGYAEQQAALRLQQEGILGLPKPVGAIIVFGGIALIGWALYSMTKK